MPSGDPSSLRGRASSVVAHSFRFCVVTAGFMLIAIRDAPQDASRAWPPCGDLASHLPVLLFEHTFLIATIEHATRSHTTLIGLADVQARIDPCIANVFDDLPNRFGWPNPVGPNRARGKYLPDLLVADRCSPTIREGKAGGAYPFREVVGVDTAVVRESGERAPFAEH